MACNNEKKLTNLGRFKCKKLFTGDKRVAEQLILSLFFDTKVGERSANGDSSPQSRTSASKSACTPQQRRKR
jgi:hypothetical protein